MHVVITKIVNNKDVLLLKNSLANKYKHPQNPTQRNVWLITSESIDTPRIL